ncbi:MAG: hypothetical protein II842_03850 [Butyrivibrio sp.]|nr:hypothetical protein [Butyrivibrio sp.]
MKNKTLLLFRTLLKSTSSLNILKTTDDKKKKGKIIGGYIGMGILYLMLIGYCLLTAIGFGYLGALDQMADMTAIMICALSFVFTMLKAGSYLFGFREYEMLMALPFSEKTIVSSKFLYMYMKNLPWNLSISIAMLIGYGLMARPAIYIYPLWILLSLILPVIPMLAASFIGFIIARIGTAFKHWKAVQTALTFAFVFLAFSLRFILEKLFRNNEIEDVIQGLSDKTQQIGSFYPPISWFTKAVTEGKLLLAILLIAITVILFELTFSIIARSYKKMNSTMKTSVAKQSFKMTTLKRKSPSQAIAEKELRRFIGSTNYFVNVGFGYILALVLGVASLFIGFDRIIGLVVQGAPVTSQMILPAIPFVIYFLTGMAAMTTCSPSLEGKNYWILKSSPLTNRQIYLGKIMANLYLAIPAQLITTLLFCISAKASFIEMVSFMILGVVLSCFSSVFGCACGIHFMKLDWENEIEVIKQGTGVVVYMFPNMILTMALLFGCIFLSKSIGTIGVTALAALIYAVLTLAFTLRVKKLSQSL